jgi:hypothetical protein
VAPGALAGVPAGPVNPLQQRLQTDTKNLVIVRAAEPAGRPKLPLLYAARWTGQPGQLIGELTDMLADQRLQDRR